MSEEMLDTVAPGAAPEGTLQFNPQSGARADKKPEPPPERKALVDSITEDIKRRKKLFGKSFERMKSDMAFAKKGAEKVWSDEKYVVNITHRHVQQRVSSLYAKNPTIVARRRKTVDFMIWDGNAESLMQAQQVMATMSDPMSQEAMMGNPAMGMQMMASVAQAGMLLADIAQAKQRIQMLKKLGETLECLFKYYIGEDTPTFKLQAKQLVRRVVTCGVGYVKLGFQRVMGRSTTLETQIADFQQRISYVENLADQLADGTIEPDTKGVEELRLAMAALQSEKDVLIREGLVFDFPRATSIIPDDDTRSLKGWVGTRRVAQEFHVHQKQGARALRNRP
jgi:hypothetical protein